MVNLQHAQTEKADEPINPGLLGGNTQTQTEGFNQSNEARQSRWAHLPTTRRDTERNSLHGDAKTLALGARRCVRSNPKTRTKIAGRRGRESARTSRAIPPGRLAPETNKERKTPKKFQSKISEKIGEGMAPPGEG
jgi:hypothetical protein